MALRLDIGKPDTRRYLTYVVLGLLALYTSGFYREGIPFEFDKIVIPWLNLTVGYLYGILLIVIMLWIRRDYI